MAKMKYAYTDEQLEYILHFAVSAVVGIDLLRFDILDRKLYLEHILNERGFGYEGFIDFELFPKDKDEPVDYVFITCPAQEMAILCTEEEFRTALKEELYKQSQAEPKYAQAAAAIIEKFNL